MRPLISVIIPAYNAERYLADALRSVLAQTYDDLEVIVVDDGSTDATAEIAARFMAADPRIRLLRQANQGVGMARNLAIRKARGEFIAPLDADDFWSADKLQRQIERFAECGMQVGLVYGWSLKIDGGGNLVGQSSGGHEGNVYVDLLCSNFIGNASSPLIRRCCFDRIGGYRCHFKALQAQGCEDWDLYLRIAEHYEFAVIREFLTTYRSYPGNMSADYHSMERSYIEMARGLRQRQPELPDPLLNWAASNFYFYLVGKSSGAGDFRQAFYCLWKSAALDPLRLISSRWYKAAIVCALGGVTRPIASVIVEGRRPWRRRRRVSRSAAKQAEASEREKTQQRQSTLFDRLRSRRQERFKSRWTARLCGEARQKEWVTAEMEGTSL